MHHVSGYGVASRPVSHFNPLKTFFLSTLDQNLPSHEPTWPIRLQHTASNCRVMAHISQFSMVNAISPIRAENNMMYIVEDGVTTIPVTLTIGTYDGYTFATEMATQLNSAGANTYTVTFNPGLQTLTVTADSATSFISGENHVYHEAGFALDDMLNFTSFTGSGPINLAGPPFIELIAKQATDAFTSALSKNILARIFLHGGYNDLILYEPSNIHPIELHIGDHHLEFGYVLRDNYGRRITLPDTVHAGCTLHLNIDYHS